MTAPAAARLRTAVAEAYRARRLGRATIRTLTPPAPSAFAAFGAGSWVVPPCRVSNPGLISIGAGVTIHEYGNLSVVAAFDDLRPSLRIGDGTNVGAQCHIACVGDIRIGADVLLAARVFIGDTYHEYDDADVAILHQPMMRPEPVVIEDGAFVGVGAAVLMGVTVGRHAYVGAGAVVTEDVAPRTLVVGNPARAVRRWDPEEGRWTALGRQP